jgi:hypothetical protein
MAMAMARGSAMCRRAALTPINAEALPPEVGGGDPGRSALQFRLPVGADPIVGHDRVAELEPTTTSEDEPDEPDEP